MSKKLTLITILVLLLFLNTLSFSQIVTYEAGILVNPTLDEGVYEYQEYFFLTGEPILLKGTVEVPDIPNDDNYSITYDFELTNDEQNIEYTRSITYDVVNKKDNQLSQTTYKATINSIDETITIDGDNYNLGSYLFDRTKIIDNTPAVDYYSGNLYFKRIYYLNGDSINNEGKIVHTINSTEDTGYKHHWGESETLILKHEIDSEITQGEDTIKWSGIIDTKNSSVDKKRFKYKHTDPQNISFRGSFIKSNTMENVVQITYSLPSVDGENIDETKRVADEKNLTKDIINDFDSLIVPKIKDIGGHWAEDEIFLLRSIKIFENNNKYFAPDTFMNRIQFGKAIANAISDIQKGDLTDQIINERDNQEKPFKDIELDDADYEYVKFLKDKGIMNGEYGYFNKYSAITRQEAVKIMIYALGLEDLAPSPPYQTKFIDDENISKWAKDSIFMADQISLVNGYPDGTFRPKKRLSKADAAVLIKGFIDHIKDTITVDYREKIINKY